MVEGEEEDEVVPSQVSQEEPSELERDNQFSSQSFTQFRGSGRGRGSGNINKNSGTLSVTPNEISLSGISNNFDILEKNQKASVSFNSFPLSPRIVEVNK